MLNENGARQGRDLLFMTGATGMLGERTLSRLLRANRRLRAIVLVRDPRKWSSTAHRLGALTERVRPVVGNLREPGLGLLAQSRQAVSAATTIIIHAAADIVFSRSLPEARAVNLDGTARVLELAEECTELRRFVFVSTAFVAGRSTGRIPEEPLPGVEGWVNSYEQSKYEAEALVRQVCPDDAVIVRPSTVVFDQTMGRVPQFNAAHHAVRLLHHGAIPMLPGTADTLVDFITADFAADGIARLSLSESARGTTTHLCAGDGAIPLGELLAESWSSFRRDPSWRTRAISEPALVDLETYRSFEQSVEQTVDSKRRRANRGLSHFIPHLAFPKQFTTARATAELGNSASPVASYWSAVLEDLIGVSAGPRRKSFA